MVKSLIITGGSFGIGKEIKDKLSSNYMDILNIDVANNIDVRDYDSIFSEFEKFFNKNNNYSFDLVLSAGVFLPVDFKNQTKENIDFVVDINLKGALYTINCFLKLRPEDKISNIVIISSISAFFHGGTMMTTYDATKAALSYIVKDLSNYPNIIINAVEPGTVRDTNIGAWKENFSLDNNFKKIINDGQTRDVENLGREVLKSDIAEIVEMLLIRNRKGVINGTTITIDGGLTSKKVRF